MPHRSEQVDGVDGARPQWFAAFTRAPVGLGIPFVKVVISVTW